jgi:hypothetical protein
MLPRIPGTGAWERRLIRRRGASSSPLFATVAALSDGIRSSMPDGRRSWPRSPVLSLIGNAPCCLPAVIIVIRDANANPARAPTSGAGSGKGLAGGRRGRRRTGRLLAFRALLVRIAARPPPACLIVRAQRWGISIRRSRTASRRHTTSGRRGAMLALGVEAVTTSRYCYSRCTAPSNYSDKPHTESDASPTTSPAQTEHELELASKPRTTTVASL